MVGLTTNEVVALFNVDEQRLRKEVEHGVLGGSSPPRFAEADIVYLRALGEIGFTLGVSDRKRLYGTISSAVRRSLKRIEFGSLIELKIGALIESIHDTLTRYEAWKQTLVKDDKILAGEPVFPASRLAVRRVGGLLMRGVPIEEIQADYPFLRSEDLEFAALYTRANPRMGRPNDPQAPAR